MTTANAGFLIIPNWVIRDSTLDGHELLVYMALFNHVDRKGYAFPGKARIAKEARMSVPTVKRTLKKLEARGLIEIRQRPLEYGKHNSNMYRVATFAREQPVDNSMGATGQSVHTWGHTDPTPGSHRPDPRFTQTPKEDTHEEDTREENSEGQTSLTANVFSFPEASDGATTSQLEYLHDLHIHYANEVAPDNTKRQWAALTSEKATEVINSYLKFIPRYDSYEGPEYGDDNYFKLSPAGREYADTGFLPEGRAF
ncbi:helix-turn-helix domain-containing protein [Cryobacterium sp. 1639]|uniref:helix-turn-helix domain-containing protein n=1 Tax=Cryobacterium inferilacus TaxID=2866629 RepID=UPI001C73D570|nr:helix-turn-helix domain-containing protein [Cryobacterium sp. 1639]MBX0299399.1 helix-turn-helix domain-containing protein [Cryobacterium sp. 1639]